AATNLAGSADLGNSIAVTLVSAGPIGTINQPLQLGTTNLSADTSANNSNQFLSETGTAQLASTNSLNAGAGTITLEGAAFQITGAAAGNAIADTSPLTLQSPALLDLDGQSETVDSLNGSGLISGGAGLLANTLTLAAPAATISTFTGVISGNGLNLIKTGLG